MKTVLFALTFLTAAVFADTQMTAKYNLPDLSPNWMVGNKIENEQMTTFIYIPKGTTKKDAKEFFGFNLINNGGNVHDTSGFKNGLAKMFPKMKIDLWELEKTKNGLLYEWSGKENGNEKIHGWGRAFKTDKGNVVLGYLTENVSDIPRARSTWLPILKEAKEK